MLPQQYCLRWKYHHSNLQTMFSQLLDRGCFCDVTLACEGQLIRAHRVVLSACSTFFDTVLTNYASERDPIIIMKDVTFADVKCLIEFMYKGEINVEHAHLASLLKTADDLKIKGLAEVSWRDDDDDRPPPPTPATEFHSPTRSIHDNNSSTYAAHGAHHHQRNGGGGGGASSPGIEQEEHNEAESPRAQQTVRMPTLTPIPLASSSSGALGNGVSVGAAISSPVDHYLGPKRKRGRPPLDDTYDVFNVRKLAGHYAAHLEQQHQAYLESSHHYSDEHHQHAVASPSPTSSAAAAAAYQHHIHQQQSKQQRIRQQQQHHQQQQQQHHQRQQRQSESDETEHDDAQTDPEWITSNLEVNVAESEQANDNAEGGDVADTEVKENKKNATEAEVVENDITITKVDKRKREGKEKGKEEVREKVMNERFLKRKHSNEEHHDDTGNVDNDLTDTHEREQRTAKSRSTLEHDRDHDHEDEPATTVPQPVEDIESAQQQALEKSGSPPISASHHKSIAAAVAVVPPPPPPPLHHPHYSKYAPEGYLLNEHGMLMTHDFVHAPTASIPSASAGAAISSGGSGGVGAPPNGSNDNDFIDIKMEDYDAADLRLTSEEMSQWQDVIKMDDYLAKGRRPQFWEEPFTRRVLDAIKNKRLEMKKAARILGVSYGTLYGRYREVYGCLKHPYSSTTFRPSQSNPLAVQPRFDIVWPTAKRDAALLPGQLEIGKIRPKDLSELWSRPQI